MSSKRTATANGDVFWATAKDRYTLSCGHPLYMNKSYTKVEPGSEMYCFRCLTQTHVRYPLMVDVASMPAAEYWWRCTHAHCRKGKAQRTGQSSAMALQQASAHVKSFPHHRVHVVDLLGNVTDAFGSDQPACTEEPLPF